MKGFIITVMLIFFPAAIYAEADNRITWQPVPEAAGYSLEIRDSLGNTVLETTVTENSFSVLKLEPGAYSFRISTVNILQQKGESTPWMDFVIEKKFIPQLLSVSQRQLVSTVANSNIAVRGTNLKPGAKFFLRREGSEIELKESSVTSDNEAVFSFKPDQSLKGIYDLAVVNRGGAESVLKSAIEIIEPEKAEFVCYAGAGYSTGVPFGKWAEYYSFSLIGASLFFQVSARNFGFENILFEAEIDSVYYRNAESMKDSSLIYSTLGIGAGYYYTVIPDFLELFCKVHGGGVYTYLTLDESPDDTDASSVDLFVMAGAGVRAYVSDGFFIDSSVGLKTVFYKDAPLYDIRISLCGGMKF